MTESYDEIFNDIQDYLIVESVDFTSEKIQHINSLYCTVEITSSKDTYYKINGNTINYLKKDKLKVKLILYFIIKLNRHSKT